MVTVLKEKGIFAGVNLFSKQDTMDITDMFKIPLFKNFTLKMREEFLDKLEYTVEEHPKGKTIIHQGTTCNALHVLLEGKLNVDVLDVSGNIVRVETIQAPRTFATPHIFCGKKQSEGLRGSHKMRDKRMRQAVFGNLKLMKKALSTDQYRKYVALINVTNNNNRMTSGLSFPDVYLADK